jgi:hypothetical protein
MWDVVGVFKVGDTAANSEMWCDLNQLRGDFEQEGGSSSLLVRVNSDADKAALKKQIDDDQRLNSAAMGEKEYYANMTSSGAPLRGISRTASRLTWTGWSQTASLTASPRPPCA